MAPCSQENLSCPPKAEIARANGAKSNGPVTPEGKAKSAQNSLKHGLNSTRVVLPHESQEEYDELEAAILRRFQPADELELELAKEMAASRWRLRRIEAMESALFKKAMREQQDLLGADADPADVRDAAYIQVAESKTMRTLTRNQNQLRLAYEKAWRELEILRQDRREAEEHVKVHRHGHECAHALRPRCRSLLSESTRGNPGGVAPFLMPAH